MNDLEIVINDIKTQLKKNAPNLTQEQRARMCKILNSKNPNLVCYGLKISEIEKIVKKIRLDHNLSYNDAINVFKVLIQSDIHDEKFACVFLLNQFKKNFGEELIDLIRDEFEKYCDTWGLCDSTMIRIVGPFLGKKDNQNLAKKTIESWSSSENLWIKRASLVILIKLTMIKKDLFISEDFVFNIIEKMLQSKEDYLQKGVGWLLKTCSKYKPDVIVKYLNKNKPRLPRLILRYASEKLPKETREDILNKETVLKRK